MGSFANSIKRQIERVNEEIDAKCYAIFADLASTVIYNCPILRGNLINDFWPAANTYDTTTVTPVNGEGDSRIGPHSDVTGSGSIGRINLMKPMKTFYGKDGFLSFSTSVPYAYSIEMDGHSRKVPNGFMRNSVIFTAAKYK